MSVQDWQDPRYVDRVSVLVGEVLRATCPQQKHLAQAFDVSQGRISQIIRHYPSLLTLLRHVDQARAHSRVDGAVLCVLALVHFLAGEYEGMTPEQLRAAELELSAEETEAEGLANIQERCRIIGLPADTFASHLREGAALLRWIAIDWARGSRGIASVELLA